MLMIIVTPTVRYAPAAHRCERNMDPVQHKAGLSGKHYAFLWKSYIWYSI